MGTLVKLAICIKILNNQATPTYKKQQPAIAASSRYERFIPINSILRPNLNTEGNIARLKECYKHCRRLAKV